MCPAELLDALAVGSKMTGPAYCSALGGSPWCLCLLHMQQGVPHSTPQSSQTLTCQRACHTLMGFLLKDPGCYTCT